MSEDYEVGYGKPPKHTRFKKGRSGNPKGRPKGSRNFSTDLKATLEQPVRINSGGTFKSVSTQLAVLLRLREMALNGNARALDRVLDYASTYNDEEAAEAANLSRSDSEILDDYVARKLRATEGPETPGEDDTLVDAEPGQDGAEQKSGEGVEDNESHDVLR